MKIISTLAIVTLGSGLALFAQSPDKMHMKSADHKFAMEASQGGMAEVELGQLALKNADNQKVKDFGQKMVDDHSKAGDELKQLAMKDNITLPSAVSSKDQALITRLSSLHGAAFDKAYISAMVKDHETDIAEFEKEASHGQDSDLKEFASKTLPTLKSHLEMAKEAATAVGASTR
jgi:putative membrane protein